MRARPEAILCYLKLHIRLLQKWLPDVKVVIVVADQHLDVCVSLETFSFSIEN